MNEQESMNFVTQYLAACFRPSSYRDLIEDKKHSLAAYVLVLCLFLLFIENILPFLAWDASVGGMRNLILNVLPEFRIENGVMTCDTPLFLSVGDACTVKVDTSVDAYARDDLSEEYTAFYFSKTNMVAKNASMNRVIPYTDLGSVVINNKYLVNMLPVFYLSMVITTGLLYLATLGQYLFMTLFYALLCRGLLRDPGGDRLPFMTTFAITIYARTLPSLITVVGTVLGLPVHSILGEVLMVFLTMLYIFRGQASVLKMDFKKR